MSTLSEVVKARHSSRKFLPDRPVAAELLDEALAPARRAPSTPTSSRGGCSWPPVTAATSWRPRLSAQAHISLPADLGLPETFAPLRRELGAMVYGAMGVARDDAEGRWAAQLRNFEFFGAPTAGIVCMHRDLGLPDAPGWGCTRRHCCLP